MLKVLKSLVVGPLEPYAVGFAAELERQGYTIWVAEKQVSLAAHLSRWRLWHTFRDVPWTG